MGSFVHRSHVFRSCDSGGSRRGSTLFPGLFSLENFLRKKALGMRLGKGATWSLQQNYDYRKILGRTESLRAKENYFQGRVPFLVVLFEDLNPPMHVKNRNSMYAGKEIHKRNWAPDRCLADIQEISLLQWDVLFNSYQVWNWKLYTFVSKWRRYVSWTTTQRPLQRTPQTSW